MRTSGYLFRNRILSYRSAWGSYALTSATHVSIVTQMTILLGVLVVGALFSEGNTKQRLLGAGMILAGVVVVLLT